MPRANHDLTDCAVGHLAVVVVEDAGVEDVVASAARAVLARFTGRQADQQRGFSKNS